MNEGELRVWVRAQLGRDIPDSVWNLVRLDGYLNVVDDDERDDLLRRVTQVMQVFSSAPMRKRRTKMTSSGEKAQDTILTPAERDRTSALSEYYAKAAAAMPDVRRFRREVLQGRLLTKAEVASLFASSAARMLTPRAMQERDIPLMHESEVLSDEYVQGERYTARLRVTPPGIEVEFEHSFRAGDSFWTKVPGNRIVDVRYDGLRHETTAFHGSLLDQLRTVGDMLSAIPWRPGDATWFILTGDAPKFSPMLSNMSMSWGSFGGHGKVTLEVEPWISAPTVAAMYAKAQKRILGRTNRPLSARRLELFRFVVSAADDDLEIPPWRSLMEKWNKKHKTWRYDNVRNLSRDFWAARRALTFPDFMDVMKGVELKHGQARKR